MPVSTVEKFLETTGFPPMKLNRQNARKQSGVFDVQAFLDSPGVTKKCLTFERSDILFSQGDLCKDVMYIQEGHIELSVVSKSGKEAIVAILKPGDFVGEGALAGQTERIETATAITSARVLAIGLQEMLRVLRAERVFSDRLFSYVLERNTRIEEDLIDQLFNSCEKRLARTLLMLAGYGNRDKHEFVLSKVSQEKLAKMVGTTRPRINLFMNKFKKLGLINYDGGLHVNESLLGFVLGD